MTEVVASSMARVSFATVLLLVSAALALTLSAIGLYGVVSYVVGQRTSEIGLRLALGARGAQVWRMVMAQSTRLTVLGVVFGLAGTLAVSRVLRSLLYGVEPTDPMTLVAAALLLLAMTLLATHIPARRAARVDPLVAMRD
jgi:ABC-type antimicrobial peptide transport system permease subunit